MESYKQPKSHVYTAITSCNSNLGNFKVNDSSTTRTALSPLPIKAKPKRDGDEGNKALQGMKCYVCVKETLSL